MDCRQKIYLTLIASAIIIIALLLFLVIPLVHNIKSLSGNLIEKKNTVESFKEKSDKYLKHLKNEYANLEPEISKINSSFIDPEKAVDFILAVERIANLTNNYQEIREISSSKEKDVLSFQISLWGSFPNLIKFLAQLENMDYFVDSSSFQITKIEENELKGFVERGILVSADNIRSTINIKVYTKNDKN